MALFDICNIILPLVLVLYLKLTRLNKDLINKAIMILYSICIILLVGTRSVQTGDDTISYYHFYQLAHISGHESKTLNNFEPLFSLIGLICAKLDFSFMFFNVIIAFITMYFFSITVIKMKCNAFISIFLYTVFCLHLNMMNQVRQALAMMIALYAITFLNENKKGNFIIWTIIASLFHLSCLIILILLPIWKIKIRKKTILLYILFGIIFALTYESIFKFIINYIGYGHYITEEWRYGAHNFNAILNFIVRLIMLFFSLLFYSELKSKGRNIDGYYHMIFICTVLQLLCIFNNAIGRITTIFYLAYLFIISEIIDHTETFTRNKPLLYPAFIVGFMGYYYIYLSDKATIYDSILF